MDGRILDALEGLFAVRLVRPQPHAGATLIVSGVYMQRMGIDKAWPFGLSAQEGRTGGCRATLFGRGGQHCAERNDIGPHRGA